MSRGGGLGPGEAGVKKVIEPDDAGQLLLLPRAALAEPAYKCVSASPLRSLHQLFSSLMILCRHFYAGVKTDK